MEAGLLAKEVIYTPQKETEKDHVEGSTATNASIFQGQENQSI